MLRVAIILGRVLPGRKGEVVSRWVYDTTKRQRSNDAEFEYVDVKDFHLPLLDEPGIFHKAEATKFKVLKMLKSNRAIPLTVRSTW